jgi:hypothetical protein
MGGSSVDSLHECACQFQDYIVPYSAMNPEDPESVVNLDSFMLAFMSAADSHSTENGEVEEDDEAEYDSNAILDEMLAEIPDDAVFIGTLNDEVCNFTSWKTEIYFHVIPLKNTEFTWALFGIAWDDNWGRWDWECYARATMISNPHEAARTMMRRLFKEWGYDLGADSDNAYTRFLDEI